MFDESARVRFLVLVVLFAVIEPAAGAQTAGACTSRPGVDHLICAGPLVPPPAAYGIHQLDDAHRERMLGHSWRQGCPVYLDDLSLVVVPYVDQQGTAHSGEVVIGSKYAASVERIFGKLFKAAFPIEHMEPMEAFDGDDTRSMDANNTSGFNCRRGAGFGEWSRHSYGDAIDLNPVWNPQVKGPLVRPDKGVKFLNRAVIRPGMATPNGVAVKIFRAEGWHWGGLWPRPQDFQHFSVSGH